MSRILLHVIVDYADYGDLRLSINTLQMISDFFFLSVQANYFGTLEEE